MFDLYARLLELLASHRPAVLVTVIASPDPQLLGSKWLVAGEEVIPPNAPSIPISEVQDIARQALDRQQVIVATTSEYTLLAEPAIAKPHLIVLGCGHVGQAVAQLGKMLDFSVTAVDDRPDYANRVLFPQTDQIICQPFDQALQHIPLNQNTFVVIVTRGHRYDQDCLALVANNPVRYVGMIGSRRRVRGVMQQLADQGIPREALERVNAPIGLNIGAETPAEIAVSIMAQIIAVRYNKLPNNRGE